MCVLCTCASAHWQELSLPELFETNIHWHSTSRPVTYFPVTDSFSLPPLASPLDFRSSVSTKCGCASWIMELLWLFVQTFLRLLFKLPHRLYDQIFIKVVSYNTINLLGLYILFQRKEGRSYPPTFSLGRQE